MRILHLLDTSAPVISGYSSRSRAIVNAQRAAGLDPVVLTSARHNNESGSSLEYIDGIKHYRSLKSTTRQYVPLMEMHCLRKRAVEVARMEGVELIHAHSPILTGIPGWMAARQLGLKCVYEMRSLWEDAAAEKGDISESSLRYRLTRNAETFLMRRVDAVVCICEGLRGDVAARGISKDRLHVVPNGVDVSRFIPQAPDNAIRKRLGLDNRVVVGYIGTFFGFEGVEDLVEALAQLVNNGRDDIAGLIVGRGTTYEACRDIAKRHGLSDRIIHPGHVPSEEVEGLYSVMSILAYPRRSLRITELVTPLKPLEAMAMGKAVVGSDVGGIQELISNGVTGIFHKSGDVAELAKQIVTLVDDSKLRHTLGVQARKWVTDERDWKHIVLRYFPIYEALTGRPIFGS